MCARTARPGGDRRFGGGPAGEFFDGLGDAWPLTAAQRDRILPAVEAALDAGWPPRELAAFTGSNTGGLRNPYAVLTTRLSPTELPRPPGPRSRPPWCGECDERTRMLGFDGDEPRPCPRCKTGGGLARVTQILSVPSSPVTPVLFIPASRL